MNTTTTATIFKCPVCAGMLMGHPGRYACKNGHSFDIAREGYVNLLYPPKKGREQGDNKEMVQARRRFLNHGYFHILSDRLAAIAGSLLKGNNGTLLDSGCGEGYYLENVTARLSAQKTGNVAPYGFDISKSAIKLAAKKNPSIRYAVANVFALPVLDRSVDIAISVFSPFNEEEIHRTTKDRSFWIIVTPGPYHLVDLKSRLYDKVELNDAALSLKRFKVLDRIVLKYPVVIEESEVAGDLIKMTPYYWKTDRSRIERFLTGMTVLRTGVEFEITVCSK